MAIHKILVVKVSLYTTKDQVALWSVGRCQNWSQSKMESFSCFWLAIIYLIQKWLNKFSEFNYVKKTDITKYIEQYSKLDASEIEGFKISDQSMFVCGAIINKQGRELGGTIATFRKNCIQFERVQLVSAADDLASYDYKEIMCDVEPRQGDVVDAVSETISILNNS